MYLATGLFKVTLSRLRISITNRTLTENPYERPLPTIYLDVLTLREKVEWSVCTHVGDKILMLTHA